MWSNKKPEKVSEQAAGRLANMIPPEALNRDGVTARDDHFSTSAPTVSVDDVVETIAETPDSVPVAAVAPVADALPNPFQVDLDPLSNPVGAAAPAVSVAPQPVVVAEPEPPAAVEAPLSERIEDTVPLELSEPLIPAEPEAPQELVLEQVLPEEPAALLQSEEGLAPISEPILEPQIVEEAVEPPFVSEQVVEALDEPLVPVRADFEPTPVEPDPTPVPAPIVEPPSLPVTPPAPTSRDRGKGGTFAGLSRLFGPRVARAPHGKLIYAVGDVHGCDDLLEQLLDKVEADAAAMTKGVPELNPVLVFLGDYVDRGPESDKVIERLLNGLPAGFETRFLKGNHEDALLRFVEGEAEMGGRWRGYGGGETLAAYGVELKSTSSHVINWEATRVAFDQRVPREHREFLRKLETMVVYGDYAFVHAGVRPGIRLHDQTEHDVMWIRDEFLYDDAALEKVVVHGHTAQSSPFRNFRRIGVDTGAYSSGVLTAVRLVGEQADFIQTAPQNPLGRRSAVELNMTGASA